MTCTCQRVVPTNHSQVSFAQQLISAECGFSNLTFSDDGALDPGITRGGWGGTVSQNQGEQCLN